MNEAGTLVEREAEKPKEGCPVCGAPVKYVWGRGEVERFCTNELCDYEEGK